MKHSLQVLSAALLSSLFFVSCEPSVTTGVQDDSQAKGIESLVIPTGFDWETQKTIAVDLTVNANDGSVLPNAQIDLYEFNPIDPETGVLTEMAKAKGPVFSGVSDAQGKIATEIALNKTSSELYVIAAFAGLPNYKVDIQDKLNVMLTLGGKLAHQDASAVVNKKSDGFFTFLDVYNEFGVPNNLLEPDVVDAALLATVHASFPEYKPVPKHNPQYIQEGTEPNIVLKEEAEVWLTFVHEGAGYMNTVGYYTFPIGQQPTSKEAIEKHIVAFPNTSYDGDNLSNGTGDLIPGDKVRLRYWNEETGEFQDRFPANTVIAWFLVANGWDYYNKNVRTENRFVYSTPDYNVETATDKKRHNVLLADEERELLFLGFEDLHREENSDEDFNDAIFYSTVVPFDAVDTDPIPPVCEPDPEKEFENNSDGTLVFEDLWPAKGDYDFNDLVIDYEISRTTNSASQVTKLVFDYTVRAIGAGLHNGFAIELPISPDLVADVEGTVFDKDFTLFQLSPNRTEAGQSKAVIPFFEDSYSVLTFVEAPFINTVKGNKYSEPVKRTITVTFTEPINVADLGLPPFNPFLIKNAEAGRGVEVHLANHTPTDLVDASLFFTGNDDSDLGAGRTYVSESGMPWALHLSEKFDYPYEKTEITKAYKRFGEWVESAGTLYPDWFIKTNSEYRDASSIYEKP